MGPLGENDDDNEVRSIWKDETAEGTRELHEASRRLGDATKRGDVNAIEEATTSAQNALKRIEEVEQWRELEKDADLKWEQSLEEGMRREKWLAPIRPWVAVFGTALILLFIVGFIRQASSGAGVRGGAIGLLIIGLFSLWRWALR